MYTAEQKTTVSINCLTIRKTTKNGLAKKTKLTIFHSWTVRTALSIGKKSKFKFPFNFLYLECMMRIVH